MEEKINQEPRKHSLNEELKNKVNIKDNFIFTEREEVHLKVKELNNKIYRVNLETWAVKEVVDVVNP